jgi:hypothetical protein
VYQFRWGGVGTPKFLERRGGEYKAWPDERQGVLLISRKNSSFMLLDELFRPKLKARLWRRGATALGEARLFDDGCGMATIEAE